MSQDGHRPSAARWTKDRPISSTPYRCLRPMRRRRPRVKRSGASPSSRRSRDMEARLPPCRPPSERCASSIGTGLAVLSRRPPGPSTASATRAPIAWRSQAEPPASRSRMHALAEPRRGPHRRRPPWTRAAGRARAGGSMATRPTLRHSLLPEPGRSKARRTRIQPRRAVDPPTGTLAKARGQAPVSILSAARCCWPRPWRS